MSQLSKFLRDQHDGRGGIQLAFMCPGCKTAHAVGIGAGSGPRWTYNGNPDKPTFQPSVLVSSGHLAPGYNPANDCWCDYNAKHPDEPASFTCGVCHSFVTDGRIQFLSDCTHALAGQTVDLPEWVDP